MNKIILINVILAITVIFLTYQLYRAQVTIVDLNASNQAAQRDNKDLQRQLKQLKEQRLNSLVPQSTLQSGNDRPVRNRLATTPLKSTSKDSSSSDKSKEQPK